MVACIGQGRSDGARLQARLWLCEDTRVDGGGTPERTRVGEGRVSFDLILGRLLDSKEFLWHLYYPRFLFAWLDLRFQQSNV